MTALCASPATTDDAPPLQRHARLYAGHPRLSAQQDVDGRDIGVRKHAVLRTAMPGQDEWRVCASCLSPFVAAKAGTQSTTLPFRKHQDVDGRDKPGHDEWRVCATRGRTELVGAPAQPLHCHARACRGHPRLHYYDVNGFGGVAILHLLPADFRFFVFVQSLVVSAQVSTRRPS